MRTTAMHAKNRTEKSFGLRPEYLISSLIIFCLLFIGYLLLLPAKTYAVTDNWPGIRPQFPAAYGNFADCTPNEHAQDVWVSPQGNSAGYTPTYTLAPSQDRLSLQYNFAAAVCDNNTFFGNIRNKNLIESRLIFTNTPTTNITGTSVGGIVAGTAIGMDYGCMNLYNLRYAKTCPPVFGGDPNLPVLNVTFNIDGLSSLSQGTHTITVTPKAKIVNHFFDGFTGVHAFQCVQPPYNYVGDISGPGCNDVDSPFTLTIIVPPPPPSFDLVPSRTVNNAGRVVNFSVTNNGAGVSRFVYNSNVTGVMINRTIWRTRGGVQTVVYNDSQNNQILQPSGSPGNVWTGDVPYSAIPGGVNPGDTICAEIGVNPSAGVTDGAATVGWRSDPPGGGGNTIGCATFVAKPYFRVYSGDTVVGRNITNPDGTCNNTKATSSIHAFSAQSGTTWFGSGSQFAASATSVISGFMSASMHNGVGSNTSPDTGLTFGNTGNPAGQFGFDTTGYLGCSLDVNKLKDAINAAIGDGNIPTASVDPTVGEYFISDSTDINIGSPGDIFSTGISYSSVPNWSNIDEVKPIVVIAIGHDINIRPSVSQLDGLYIAIPDPVTGLGGTINTCYTSNFNSCKTNTLAVTGAFLAKQVKLNRLKGDIATTVSGGGSGNEDPGSNMAEYFIFTPDLYLALSQLGEVGGGTTIGTIDSIAGLPPVL